jgi:hypothetical protein
MPGSYDKHAWRHRLPWSPSPLLNRGWDDGHDSDWEHALVEKIRRGQAAPYAMRLYDYLPSHGAIIESGFIGGGDWEYAEERSKDADRSGSPWLNDEAIARRKPLRDAIKKARAEEAAAEKARWEAQRAIWAEERKERAAARAEEERLYRAERERFERTEEERKRRRAEQDAEWERESERVTAERIERDLTAAEARQRAVKERDAIMAGKWECQKCLTRSLIQPIATGYVLTCRGCGKTSWAPHETFAAIVARNAQEKPLTDG